MRSSNSAQKHLFFLSFEYKSLKRNLNSSSIFPKPLVGRRKRWVNRRPQYIGFCCQLFSKLADRTGSVVLTSNTRASYYFLLVCFFSPYSPLSPFPFHFPTSLRLTRSFVLLPPPLTPSRNCVGLTHRSSVTSECSRVGPLDSVVPRAKEQQLVSFPVQTQKKTRSLLFGAL